MKTIATHSGSFQSDEVFGVAILKLLYPKAKVTRTRDPVILNKADIRLDVGKKYDVKTNDFDHHQKEGAGKRENGIPYASAGLIWKHFGKKLAEEEAWRRIDMKLIQFIDANDNGVKTFKSEKAKPFTIIEIIDNFNPNWQSTGDYNKAFDEAVKLAMEVLERELIDAKGNVKAAEIIRKAIKKSDGNIIILDKYAPWKKTAGEESKAKYVVDQAVDKDWPVHVVPVKPDSFEARKDLPKKWAGLEFEELQKITGVKDAVFCHRGLFICGAKSKEGAVKLAELTVKE